MIGKKCIVRGDRSGLYFGEVVKIEEKTCEIKNVQNLFFYDGAARIEQLATEGTKKPQNCKFTMAVSYMTIYDLIQIIPCTDNAIKNIEAVSIWKIK
jgi:hypothetical protein